MSCDCTTCDDLKIRLVSVEFLRPGPPHNQLLSPLTPYLAVCGNAAAGVVNVPYEHGRFQRLLKELRYEKGDSEDRLAMLHDVGTEIGRFLGGVPGLAGALAIVQNEVGTLVHLRLTHSASELAVLPFELAKTPVMANVAGEDWLAMQTRPPVCITRKIRTITAEDLAWPNKPRILFISGDPQSVPFEEHRNALIRAIEPFQYPNRDEPKSKTPDDSQKPREQFGELLTILKDPTMADVFKECRNHCYTHIHVLTHGAPDPLAQGLYGIVFRGENGDQEIVSGNQFRTAITSIEHRPSVITLASCDSGNVGSVIIPGASFAHELHQAGIPLVVASQFPLSKEGSIPLTERLYKGLLWAEHPLALIHQARSELNARYTTNWHDWASLVVYEALPGSLKDNLETLRYWQARRAENAALEKIDLAVAVESGSLKELEQAVKDAVARMPLKGGYGAECIALRASSFKRLAQAAFALNDSTWKDPYEPLNQALLDYGLAAHNLMINSSLTLQRIATLHWVLVQKASLSMVLGKDCEKGVWEAAQLSAEEYLQDSDTENRAWAYGSLAELCLIKLGDNVPNSDKKKFYDCAVEHAQELGKLYPKDDEFPVKSTRRQFERYIDWWGTDRFEKGLKLRGFKRLTSWHGQYGVIATAQKMIDVLTRTPSIKDSKTGRRRS